MQNRVETFSLDIKNNINELKAVLQEYAGYNRGGFGVMRDTLRVKESLTKVEEERFL